MTELRREFRGRTYLGGLIVFENDSGSHDCVVRNLSQNGAKLSFAHPPQIPMQFELAIHKKGRHQARLVWLDYDMAGVTFAAAEAPDLPMEPPLEPTVTATPPRPAGEPAKPAASQGDGVVISFIDAKLRLGHTRRDDDALS